MGASTSLGPEPEAINQMDMDLRRCAEYFDLATCGMGFWSDPGCWRIHGPDEDWYWPLNVAEDNGRVTELCSSGKLLGDLVPIFGVGRPLEMHRERRSDWRKWPIICRFSYGVENGAKREKGSLRSKGERDLPERLGQELQTCQRMDRFSPKLAQLILAVPQYERDVIRCRDVLSQYFKWLELWVRHAARTMKCLPSLEAGDDEEVRTDLHIPASDLGPGLCHVEAAIAGLIQPSALAMDLCQCELGKLPAASIVSAFKPIIQPDTNIGLPPVYVRFRPLLYAAICQVFREEVGAAKCDGFELWARLIPAPYDLFDDFASLIEDDWFLSLNEHQICRVGLLLADIAVNIPSDKRYDQNRDEMSRRLVSWLESACEPRQQVARYALNEACDWWCRPVWSWPEGAGAPNWLREVVNSMSERWDSLGNFTTLLEAFEDTKEDPWHRGQRWVSRPEYDGPRNWRCERRFSVDFEASALKSVAQISENALGRAKALWNLSCLAASDEQFAETAYNAFHTRRIEGSSETLARTLLRGSLSGFLQDFGPVNPEDGRWFEQAAAKIELIKRNRELVNLLRWSVSKRTQLPFAYSKDVLDELFHMILVDQRLAKNMAVADLDDPRCRSYLMIMLDRVLVSEYRKRQGEIHADPAVLLPTTEISKNGNAKQVDDAKVANRVTKARQRIADAETARRRSVSCAVQMEGLKNLPVLEAAVGFYLRVCRYSRDDTAELLRITPESLDYLTGKATEELKTQLRKEPPSSLDDIIGTDLNT